MYTQLWFYLCAAGANIFITADGSIKIGDFGLCVQMKNTKTKPEDIKGTAGTAGNIPLIMKPLTLGPIFFGLAMQRFSLY